MKITIIYNKANTLNLPYADKDKNVQYVKFVPGEQKIEKDIWDAIVEYNGKRFDHYGRFLQPLNEDAETEDGLNYEALTVKEMSELIENTMDIGKLGDIENAENKRDKPRKSVLKEIEKQIDAISAFEKKVEAGS